MFPEGFIKRIRDQENIDAESLLQALDKPSPVSIRINGAKWEKKPLGSEPVAWCRTGFYLGSRPSFTLDPLFHSGCYYPQEASGMFLEEILHQVLPDGKCRVLDLCGAPGGKSTHLSALIGQDSLLVSNEVIRSRSLILAESLTKWGASNTLVTQNDPSAFRDLPGFFDMILVDAPCSGEGMFRDKAARREWSDENASHCSLRQKRILMDVWPSLRENGILIYSTCTFNPDENEKNIRWLLDKQEAVSLSLDVKGYTGIKEIEYQGITGYGFLPDKVKGEGLFFSVIRKKSGHRNETVRIRKNPFVKASREEIVRADLWTGFKPEQVVRMNEDLIAIPGDYKEMLMLFDRLRVIRFGTKILTIKGNSYLPSHEAALSMCLRSDAFPGTELEIDQAINYLKRGILEKTDVTRGWFLVKYKDVNLGFANNLGTRINNYFPVGWRIRIPYTVNSDPGIIMWDE